MIDTHVWKERDGLQIIPSSDVAPGCKRTDVSVILVNPANYAILQTMTAKGLLVALSILREEFEGDDE